MKWAHYDLKNGFIHASNTSKVSDEALATIGRAQVEISNDIEIDKYKINLDTLQPELLPPPPPQPLTIADHIFVAMVRKGEIDINDVDDSILNPLNDSLRHFGKSELTR